MSTHKNLIKGGEVNIKKKVAQTIIIASTITLVLALCIFIKDFQNYMESNNSSIELINEVIIKQDEEKEDIKVDWKKLKNINKDIIGWIKIEDTNINYPIMKDNENLKYLYYSYDGKYNVNGSIFTIDNKPFQKNETTIYGHNMKSNIMFSELGKYMNEDFLKKHSTFDIYTENQNYKAKIFSCYSIGVYDEEKNISALDFESKIEYYKKASKFNINNVDNIKKIVKLSTCSYLNNHTTPTNQRYYILAKLEKVY